jgi:hypothetical protein
MGNANVSTDEGEDGGVVVANRKSFSGRDGRLRIEDGSTPPYYIEIPFVEMNLESPWGKPRPVDPIVPTVGGYVHSPTGPDYDSPLYEPLTLNFSFWINDTSFKVIRDAFCNPDLNSPWTVGPHTWSTTKGRGSIIRFDNTYIATQPFFDQMKKAVCFEATWTQTYSGSVVGQRWDEVYIPPQNVTVRESADFLTLQVQALVYGNISTISGFTSGTASA